MFEPSFPPSSQDGFGDYFQDALPNPFNFDDDLFSPFLTQPKPGENFDDLFNSFAQTQQSQLSACQYLTQYSRAVNENMEFNLEPGQFDMLTNKCCSPLFEALIQSEVKLGSLQCGEKSDNTYDSTYTAVKSFNFWWMHHTFDVQTDPELYHLRFSLGDMVDGFQALCSCSHDDRNILLAFWVCKMVKRHLRADETADDPVLGSTKVTYLNSIQRALKLYEKKNKLIDHYGADWSWRNSTQYSQLRGALDRETVKNEMGLSPSKTDRAVDFMSEAQFFALLQELWNLSENGLLPFSTRLKYKLWYFILGVISFGCLRGREEIAYCLREEFEVISGGTISFQMKRPFKSHKLTANKKITRKPARFIVGERFHSCFDTIMSHRNPQQAHDRIFVHPLSNISQQSDIWWSCEPMGENPIGDITKKATKLLQKAGHELFSADERFTNSSLRKYHSDKLMQANAPLIHQQASLAQNVRAYTEKRKQKKENSDETQLKIAQIVAGERNVWHSPQKENCTLQDASKPTCNLPSGRLPFKKRIVLATSAQQNIGEQPSNTPKQMHFSFSNSSSNFSFTFDL